MKTKLEVYLANKQTLWAWFGSGTLSREEFVALISKLEDEFYDY